MKNGFTDRTPERLRKLPRQLLDVAGALFPHALISDRTALEQRPAADGSIFLITDSRSTDLELPTQSALHMSNSFYA